MLASGEIKYDRNLSLEDDFVAVRLDPFNYDDDNATLPAVAVDWNSKQAVFNVTLLSISHDGAQERLWSDSFSINKIKRRHLELCLVHPDLQTLLPGLPNDPQGIWGYIKWTYVGPELCKKLEEYFKNAFNICGWKLLSSVFFGEPIFFEEHYTISTFELKRKQFVKDVEQLQQEFQRHLAEQGKISSADLLFEWYEALWDCLAKITDAEKKLLAFDCEPYEEMRDIAQMKRTECASVSNEQSMTASVLQDNVQTFSQWEEQYIDSVKKINELRIAHFKTSLPRLQEIFKLLQSDSDKFAKDNDRLTVETKLYEFEKESLQSEIEMLNCGNQLKLFERDKIRRDAIALDEDLSMPEKLNEKELQVYTKQCEILTVSCDIQDKSEKMVQLDLRKLGTGVINDTFARLKGNLTKRLSIISRKKAVIRNKKKSCEDEVEKLTRKTEEEQEQYSTHHAVQLKIEKRREEDEEKKEARLEERQKTLLRLKEYKKKYPKSKEVKPPRYQPPSIRKQEQTVRDKSGLDTTATTPPQNSTSKKDESQKQSNQCHKDISSSSTTTTSSSPPGTSNASSSSPGTFNASPSPPGTACAPPPPPPPPTAIPPPPPTGLGHHRRLAVAMTSHRLQSSDSNRCPLGEPSSLTEQSLDLDALIVARSRLKKQGNGTCQVNNNSKPFPFGNDLTRAIQSVKLRKVVEQEKPAELSPDGAEFLKKALERMNKFTSLSFDVDEDENIEEQEW